MTTIDTIRTSFFIDGGWRAPAGSATIPVISPLTEEQFGSVPEATTADVDAAVEAARTAFRSSGWRDLSPADRAAHLRRFADELDDAVQTAVHRSQPRRRQVGERGGGEVATGAVAPTHPPGAAPQRPGVEVVGQRVLHGRRHRGADAGVVDQDVDGAGGLHRLGDAGGVGDIQR